METTTTTATTTATTTTTTSPLSAAETDRTPGRSGESDQKDEYIMQPEKISQGNNGSQLNLVLRMVQTNDKPSNI